MDNKRYQELYNLPKRLNDNILFCAKVGEQAKFNGYGIMKPDYKFTVIQNRKGHLRRNYLTYVLTSQQLGIMARVDLVGQPHQGVATPHVHIFDDAHDNGMLAIPTNELAKYDPSAEIIKSLWAFLVYNHFDTKDTKLIAN